MAKFTLLEVHLDGAEFTANAPGVDGAGSDTENGESGDDEGDGGTGGLPLAALLLLALTVVAVVAVSKLLGHDEDEDALEAI
ncbi:hypothetical protein [Haloarcula litorea]|uniref:hypothetical protein n=1 Tax=Haloarcula litorea TaxID=3032579 RepID=UPI0023E7A10C|nr:hypothetical protein [Halomicroarcula sp. GDY20]